MLKRISSGRQSQSQSQPTQQASMMNLYQSSSNRRVRRSGTVEPTATLKLDLDAYQIENLVEWLCSESSDKQLAQSYHQRYHGLAERRNSSINQQQTVWTQEELCDIIPAIQTLLSSVQEPTSPLVAEAHITIGIIHQRLNQDARATQSFMQALWVQASWEDVSPVAVGLTKTRLALAYGRKGDYEKAISLLEKAMQDYQEGGLTEEHELFSRASEALQGFRFAENHRSSKRSNSRRISQGAA